MVRITGNPTRNYVENTTLDLPGHGVIELDRGRNYTFTADELAQFTQAQYVAGVRHGHAAIGAFPADVRRAREEGQTAGHREGLHQAYTYAAQSLGFRVERLDGAAIAPKSKNGIRWVISAAAIGSGAAVIGNLPNLIKLCAGWCDDETAPHGPQMCKIQGSVAAVVAIALAVSAGLSLAANRLPLRASQRRAL